MPHTQRHAVRCRWLRYLTVGLMLGSMGDGYSSTATQNPSTQSATTNPNWFSRIKDNSVVKGAQNKFDKVKTSKPVQYLQNKFDAASNSIKKTATSVSQSGQRKFDRYIKGEKNRDERYQEIQKRLKNPALSPQEKAKLEKEQRLINKKDQRIVALGEAKDLEKLNRIDRDLGTLDKNLKNSTALTQTINARAAEKEEEEKAQGLTTNPASRPTSAPAQNNSSWNPWKHNTWTGFVTGRD